MVWSDIEGEKGEGERREREGGREAGREGEREGGREGETVWGVGVCLVGRRRGAGSAARVTPPRQRSAAAPKGFIACSGATGRRMAGGGNRPPDGRWTDHSPKTSKPWRAPGQPATVFLSAPYLRPYGISTAARVPSRAAVTGPTACAQCSAASLCTNTPILLVVQVTLTIECIPTVCEIFRDVEQRTGLRCRPQPVDR